MPRWLLAFALLCGMLLSPIAMAKGDAMMPVMEQGSGHCADQGGDQHLPKKQVHCMGACFAVEASVARVQPAAMTLPAAPAMPLTSSLGSILLERDTPPPRLA